VRRARLNIASAQPQAITARIHELVTRERTQRAFAERVGIPPQAVHKYLRGTVPDYRALLGIALAYNVTTDWILTGQAPRDRRPSAAPRLDFRTYAARARTTARYPHRGLLGLYYTALGLAGEAGEVSNKVSKVIRDDAQHLTKHARAAIADELGDTLWYAASVAYELGTPLESIAAANLAKLQDRAARKTIGGHGDRR